MVVKLALYQELSPIGDLAFALKKVTNLLSSAAMSGARMIVFPELYLPDYDQSDLHRPVARRQDGLREQQLNKMAVYAGCGYPISFAKYCIAEAKLNYGGSPPNVGPDCEIFARAGRGEILLITDFGIVNEIEPELLSTQFQDLRKLS